MTTGKDRVRADIAAAVPARRSAMASGGTSPPPPPPAYLSGRFKIKHDGLYMTRGEDKPDLWICSRIEVIAETMDDDRACGVQIGFMDRFGRERREVFGRAEFSGDGGAMRSALAERGLTLNASRDARQAFAEWVNLAASANRAHVVYRCGWHRIGEALIYVLPDAVIGKPPVGVILQSGSREGNLFQQRGTVAEWRANIGEKASGNSRLGLAVSIAFAAPLLYLTGEDSGGVNLFGASRTGKTTSATVSASVCGGDPAGGGARALVRTWRATANSAEAVAAAHSDCGLVLDELGQADARDVGGAQYMLASGVGKTRLDRGASLRTTLRWRALYLSTGELTLADKIAESGQKMRAGMGVRLVDLPADEGAGFGAFRDLHGAESSGAFVQSLREATGRYYGAPFRAFIERLVDQVAREPQFADRLREHLVDIAGEFLAPYGAQAGQMRTVARRFALIALAGNLASDWGLTGWGLRESGEREAEWAARECFRAWVQQRGTTGSHEDAAAVLALRGFISAHGASRFDEWRDLVSDAARQEEAPPVERFRTVNRAGWRRWQSVGGEATWCFYLSATGMREALQGLDFKPALKVLAGRGLIVPGRDAIAKSVQVPGAGKQRLYEVPASAMSAEIDPLPAHDLPAVSE